MKISIIIPAHNEEVYLRACLIGVTNQIEKPYEIIVVDNNSTDKTIEIAKQFNVKVIKEKKQGITPARNAGFNAAKGDIIARTDADTVVPPDWTKKIREVFEKDSKLMGFSGSAHFYDFPDILQYNNWPITGSSKFVNIFYKHEGMFGFNMALRKSVWELIKNEICLDDTKVHEDADLAYHISQHGKVLFDKDFIVYTAPRQLKQLEKTTEYLQRGIKMIGHHHKQS